MNERAESFNEEIFCFSTNKRKHILKDPRVLPCGTKLCYECIPRYCLIKCNFTRCTQRHFIDDASYIKIDKKTIAAIEYNLQSLIQNQLESFKYNLENVAEVSKFFEHRLEDELFVVVLDIETRLESIYGELDKLKIKMNKDVDKICACMKRTQRLTQGAINDEEIKFLLEKNSEKPKVEKFINIILSKLKRRENAKNILLLHLKINKLALAISSNNESSKIPRLSRIDKIRELERLVKTIHIFKNEPFNEPLVKIDGKKNPTVPLTSHIGCFTEAIEENKEV